VQAFVPPVVGPRAGLLSTPLAVAATVAPGRTTDTRRCPTIRLMSRTPRDTRLLVAALAAASAALVVTASRRRAARDEDDRALLATAADELETSIEAAPCW
jgi:cobalamin biosynthesis protein CbiG